MGGRYIRDIYIQQLYKNQTSLLGKKNVISSQGIPLVQQIIPFPTITLLGSFILRLRLQSSDKLHHPTGPNTTLYTVSDVIAILGKLS